MPFLLPTPTIHRIGLCAGSSTRRLSPLHLSLQCRWPYIMAYSSRRLTIKQDLWTYKLHRWHYRGYARVWYLATGFRPGLLLTHIRSILCTHLHSTPERALRPKPSLPHCATPIRPLHFGHRVGTELRNYRYLSFPGRHFRRPYYRAH